MSLKGRETGRLIRQIISSIKLLGLILMQKFCYWGEVVIFVKFLIEMGKNGWQPFLRKNMI
jgi:hypothetical protein